MIHNRILILGASGFIGNALYRELDSYFDVYGTYCSQDGLYKNNQVFERFDAESDRILPLLEKLQPRYIISAFSSELEPSIAVHRDLIRYCELLPETRILYLSSSEVFSAQMRFPSYEFDKPLSETLHGKEKLAIEKLLLESLPYQSAILRLPMVLGINSPIITQLRQAIKHQAAFEVYPNRIVSSTTSEKIAQQVHYIINQDLINIYHLASSDMVHHEELFREIASKLGDSMPIFKSVFSSNEDEYQAILPKENKLPEGYDITIGDIVESSTLHDEIISLKDLP
ncbi:sugar nucleotide-binding protein [Aureitalea sp. L0-47]|uniref:sugar nucleotide-binding protein n=1 Tax=Aureitalea sp. L0-47 TaxID=2816962 RepID=UPI002238E1C3|nr:sugar nucleotide-binding protein [Aureitalea sp. L0-47]MCW5520804.1 sugar nucleotide-binding protein [Aureitalea sp. L0-47]